jgi:hypothetical protein
MPTAVGQEMKHLRYMAEMLRKDILGDALQDAWRFIRNHMACIFKGHPGWDTSETDYFCNRCYSSWPWLPEHAWIDSNDDVETFFEQISLTHKRKYNYEW